MRPQRSPRASVFLSALASAFGLFASASEAEAQVDVRLIRPYIMIGLDSSGSMEWNVSSRDSTAECSNTPDGGACNRCPTNPSLSICAPGCTDNRTRWITAVEVLTGSIQRYSCVEQPRNDMSAADALYPIPHHLPLSNNLPLFRTSGAQINDGIMDVYRERVRFGLMTFDNHEATGTNAYDGMYSYAQNRTYTLNYLGCPSRPINNGARRASADNNTADVVPGGLRSMGSPAADSATIDLYNQQIQESLTGRVAGMSSEMAGLRPSGGTPIAGLLEDAYTYWTTHPDVIDGSTGGTGDPFFRCRTRANILITDGHPNEDYRRHADTPPSTITCEGAVCPYDIPSATAMRMAMTGGSNPAVRTYVVAFNANDAITRQELEPIAVSGGTERVYYANDRPSLASALSAVIDTVSSVSSTRTPPVLGEAGTTAQGGTTQYRFNASFQVTPGMPWSGSLVRTRTACVAPSMGQPPVPTETTPTQGAGDDFAYNLRSGVRSSQGFRAQRYLWTYIPTGAASSARLRQPIYDAQATGAGAAVDLPNVSPTFYGMSTSAERDTFVSWLRGDPGTNRENQPLGDIYRSTPTYVPPPRVTLNDQTFTAYQQRVLPQTTTYGRARSGNITVATREPVIYVGTNDGILHAFNADTGEEIWGFVPPYLVPVMRSAYPNVRSMGVDGTPVVKEIYYERSATTLADDASWRTVMVVGLRTGGGAYMALDVTDPYNPKFLWQYTDDAIQSASGQAAIGTLFFSPTPGSPAVERAVAVLPGGTGTLSGGACMDGTNGRPTRANSLLSGWTSGRGARRNSVRCWQNSPQAYGQWLYIVDLQTGRQIRRLGAGPAGNIPTGSPLVGAPALFNGLAGVVSTRAYLGDADGILWRADLSSTDPRNWWLGEEYDLFWDRPYNEGRPILERPVTTTDAQNNVIIAVGSGDSEALETLENNRVASITERATNNAAGETTSVAVEANWEIRTGTNTAERDFFAGERLTGALTLFNGSLYFGTFVPRTSSDACQIGRARLWGVDIAAQDPEGSFAPRGALDRPTGCPGAMGTTYDRVTENFDGDTGCLSDSENTLLFGVTLQRPASCNVVESAVDPVTGLTRTYVSGSNSSDYRIVLQTAQTGGGIGGTVTRSFSRNIRAPIIPARVDSWATVFE